MGKGVTCDHSDSTRYSQEHKISLTLILLISQQCIAPMHWFMLMYLINSRSFLIENLTTGTAGEANPYLLSNHNFHYHTTNRTPIARILNQQFHPTLSFTTALSFILILHSQLHLILPTCWAFALHNSQQELCISHSLSFSMIYRNNIRWPVHIIKLRKVPIYCYYIPNYTASQLEDHLLSHRLEAFKFQKFFYIYA